MTVSTIYFNNLSNDKFVDIALQVCEILGDTTFDSVPQYAPCKTALLDANQALDTAYLNTKKSFNTDAMKKADEKRDKFASAVKNILMALLYLPEEHADYQKAKELYQVFKDFNYANNDSYTGQSAKVMNMQQVFAQRQADMEALHIWDYWQVVVEQTAIVRQYFSDRNAEYADRVKGEMVAARERYVTAYRNLNNMLGAMLILAPSEALNTIVRRLNALCDYCKQYYSSAASSSSSSSSSSSNAGGNQGGGTQTDGGGTNNEGGGNAGTGGNSGGGLPSGTGQEADDDEPGGTGTGGSGTGGSGTGGSESGSGSTPGTGGLPSGGGTEAEEP